MKFDTTKYKVWTWKNPLILHWILNPGLAFNELVLGQRVPKINLIEKSKKPLIERSFVPCPYCGTIHSAMKWTPQNHTAFKNWFGLYCDHCSNIIPCVRNLTSYLLLGVTFPFWVWFKNKWKEQWLTKQKEKFSKPLILAPPDYQWWYIGLRWGLFMYVLSTVISPLIEGEGITFKGLLIGIPVWILGGSIFGYIMKKILGQPNTKPKAPKTQQAT